MNSKFFRDLTMGLLVSVLVLQSSCSKDDDSLSYNDNFIQSLDGANLPEANHPMIMFEDDEDPSLML